MTEEEVQMGVGGLTDPAASPESRRKCRAPTKGQGPSAHAKVFGPAWDFTSLRTSRQVLKYFWGKILCF